MEGTMLTLEDYEKYFKEHMDKAVNAFYNQGAEKEITLRRNVEAFNRYTFIPRMLRNVLNRDLSVTILGEKISMPIALAPTAYQRLIHPDGEIAAAKAADKMNTIYTLSTVATTSIEDIQKATPNGIHWMQVYMAQDRTITQKMIARAEASGFKALVMTVDTPRVGLHLRQKRTKFLLPPHLKTPNVPELYEKAKEVGRNGEGVDASLITTHFIKDPTWDDVRWLRSVTKLPIVLKGILTAEDAKKAVEFGAAAVWVSNHGGRQLDGTRASIDALEEIAKALKGTNCEVYIDGGIRWGSDVLKALALGARTVFIGRPLAWGLAYDGENGVRKILEILKHQLEHAMALSGCRNYDDVNQSLVEKCCTCRSKL